MAEDVLKNISDRLNNTIKETNDFFNLIKNKDLNNIDYNPKQFINGTKLKIIDNFDVPDKKWVLPYTLPVVNTSIEGTHREVYNNVIFPTPIISGRQGQIPFQLTKKENNEIQHIEDKLDHGFEGWTEKQKKKFLKFAADSENKMRLESLRLQDEYNKQLASKLAMVKNELYESNRKNLLELQEIRLEKERWLLDETETKKNLESVTIALESLQKSYDNLKIELDEKNFQLNTLNGELSNYERLTNGLRADNNSMQEELHNKSEFITRLQSDVADAYLKLEVETTKFVNADKNLNSLNLAKKELSEQIKHLKVQLDSLTLTNKFMVTEKETLENRNQKLELEITTLSKEALNLQNRVRNFEISESSKVNSLQEKVNSLTLKLKTAQIDLIAVDKRLEVETLQKEVQNLKNQIKQLNNDNIALYKENTLIQKKLDQEKELVKEHLNELYASKCKTHSLTNEIKELRQNLLQFTKNNNYNNSNPYIPFKNNKDIDSYNNINNVDFLNNDLNKPKIRDLFEPTMFDGPDQDTQIKIDDLENQLTELYLEKDRLESEMTRCKIGPGSPTMQRRQHFLLEGKVTETRKKINQISGEIKSLYNN